MYFNDNEYNDRQWHIDSSVADQLVDCANNADLSAACLTSLAAAYHDLPDQLKEILRSGEKYSRVWFSDWAKGNR